MIEYSICYSRRRDLMRLAESPQDRASVERLYEFRGDEADVEIAARLYESAGEGANAAEMRRLVTGSPVPEVHP